MILPDGFRGAAFGTVLDGDAKRDPEARTRMARRLGVTDRWSFVRQVHGAVVVEAAGPGVAGEADAMFTTTPNRPLAIATADCLPLVLEGPGVVATVHAGWRGIAGGVIDRTLEVLAGERLVIERAAIGPGIRSCCYEVGADVADQFGGHVAATTWGTTSIDLAGAAEERLQPIDVWSSPDCTMCGSGFNSFRRDKTDARQVAVGWLPTD